MNQSKPTIVLEFNELCPRLMKKFIASGHLPNFKSLYEQSDVYRTDAGESPPNLEPWIQWVTVHTGLPFAQHQVFNLDDGHKLEQQQIWDVVAESGKSVWVCGSMNARASADEPGFLLPDPWSRHADSYPAGEFDDYIRFVRRQVQDHTNQDAGSSLADTLRFLRFMLSHGLSVNTVWRILRQLVTERVSGRFHWRRATILDLLQWDVFRWYFRKHQPQFSTFFANSTAHFQHMYWRNMEPSSFAVKPSAEDQENYEHAVLYGYQAMDRLVGESLKLAGNEACVVLCTALSQQPCLDYEESGGKQIYRPADVERFLAFANIGSNFDCSPLMSEEFLLRFDDEAASKQAASKLSSIDVDGRPGIRVRQDGKELVFGCGIFDSVPGNARITAGERSAAFEDYFYQFDAVKSGMHHPDGLLWIRQPGQAHRETEEKVCLTAIAPTLLALLDIKAPESMKTGGLN